MIYKSSNLVVFSSPYFKCFVIIFFHVQHSKILKQEAVRSIDEPELFHITNRTWIISWQQDEISASLMYIQETYHSNVFSSWHKTSRENVFLAYSVWKIEKFLQKSKKNNVVTDIHFEKYSRLWTYHSFLGFLNL